MAHRTALDELEQAKQRLKDAEAFPFSALLDAETIESTMAVHDSNPEVKHRDRVYTWPVTLWMFLSQALSADGSCRETMKRLAAWRAIRGLKPCSTDSTSYCVARSQRLPLAGVKALMRQTGGQLHDQADAAWLWRGRRVKIVDGTTVTCPDTPANEQTFPKRTNQKHGVGFPIVRVLVIFSLAVGSVLEAAVGPTRGKQTGENTLFRGLQNSLETGDILLGDRLFDSYRDIAELRARGVDVVFRRHATRKCDFRRGRWLGVTDHVVTWQKPKFNRSRFTREEYEALPAEMKMRELRFRVQQAGFRPIEITLVTTLLDPIDYPKDDLAELYRERWHCELDLRALKTTLGMNELRCKSPQMVEKELYVHLLAYNLIRQVNAEAAREHDKTPRRISFKACVQAINSFQPYLAACPEQHERLWKRMLKAIAYHKVGHRPNRIEPRKIKRRKSTYTYLMLPRSIERQKLCA